jgi:hypothetical protein
MSIEKFLSFENVVYDGLLYIEMKVEHELPTPLQWRFSIEDMKSHLQLRAEQDIPFAFVLDLRKMGFLQLNQIREFVDLLEKNYVILENRLVASAVVTEGSLIGNLFEIMKKFYRTKKPLKFVKSMEEGRAFIVENIAKSKI